MLKKESKNCVHPSTCLQILCLLVCLLDGRFVLHHGLSGNESGMYINVAVAPVVLSSVKSVCECVCVRMCVFEWVRE